MTDSRYFVDVFGEVVSDVRSVYDPSGLEKPYYMYGHPREIGNLLTLKDQSSVNKFKRFPLVAFIQDFAESHGSDNRYEYELSFSVLIVTSTKRDYKSEERYTNTFKPVLYPIYELLKTKMVQNQNILVQDVDYLDHRKIDRVYWGVEGTYGSDGLIFNDHLDAIELFFNNIPVAKNIFRNCQ